MELAGLSSRNCRSLIRKHALASATFATAAAYRASPRASSSRWRTPTSSSSLEIVRQRDAQHVIDVTTNGVQLTPELVERLLPLVPVYLNVSLISSDAKTRGRSWAHHADRTSSAIQLLRARQIPLTARLCRGPNRASTTSRETLEFLDECEARLVRISMPGLSRYHPRSTGPESFGTGCPGVMERVLAVRERLQTPVVISPTCARDGLLGGGIEGVVRSSPSPPRASGWDPPYRYRRQGSRLPRHAAGPRTTRQRLALRMLRSAAAQESISMTLVVSPVRRCLSR